MKSERIYAVIVAAGSGSRMGIDTPKQLLPYRGSTVLGACVDTWTGHPQIDETIVVSPQDGSLDERYREITGGRCHIVRGGAERADSVCRGLEECLRLADRDGINPGRAAVLIHDAARPGITAEIISRNIEALKSCRAVVTCVPSVDSVRIIDKNVIDSTLNKQLNYPIIKSNVLERRYVYNVQTPQSFMLADIVEAYRIAGEAGYIGTDDASVADFAGIEVAIVEGSRSNNKITTIEDRPMTTRVGTGFDVHRLVPGRELILCGTPVPYEKGLLGHSDADVATHALMDALLGAAGMGDIGRHFPDNDDRYKGADSLALLAQVRDMLSDYSIVNADITIICERPKLAPYNKQMVNNIAGVLDIPEEAVNVKATTTEGLGFTGQGEGIAAVASCSIEGRI